MLDEELDLDFSDFLEVVEEAVTDGLDEVEADWLDEEADTVDGLDEDD